MSYRIEQLLTLFLYRVKRQLSDLLFHLNKSLLSPATLTNATKISSIAKQVRYNFLAALTKGARITTNLNI